MSESPNKLIRFWQELKRRKVFKVVAMYAGTAFIILQLVDIIAQPLQLPAWTITLVIVILCVGFIITLLIAWIYDITPEGIKKTESIEVAKKKKSQIAPTKRRLKASDIIIAAMAIIIVILLYPKIFQKDTLEKLRSSGEKIVVAVMPFQNLTNDTLNWDVYQEIIQNSLTSCLSNFPKDLQVRQTESINNLINNKGITNYASITPSFARKVSQILNADVFIRGSIIKSGNVIRLEALLTDAKTEEIIKSFKKEGLSNEGNFLPKIDSLSVMVKDFLIISKLEKGLGKETTNDIILKGTTNSPDAYRYFIYGNNAFMKELDMAKARDWYMKAINIDSNFYSASNLLMGTYYNQGMYDQAKKWCLKLYKKIDQMPMLQQLMIKDSYALFFETPYEGIKYLRQILEIDDQQPMIYYLTGFRYYSIFQYEKAIPEFEKSFEIYTKWGMKDPWVYAYLQFGYSLHMTGQYDKEKELYKSAELDFPDNLNLIYRQTVLALTEGDLKGANAYLEKFRTIAKNIPVSEAVIAINLAWIYNEAGILDKSEEYYRQALSLEPENSRRMFNLAYFLIDKDRNIIEGMELVSKVLELSPEDFNYLHTKGWGLYKQGNYKEALSILQKSWDLRMKNAIYDHEAYLHLEAAKKAIANQKNN